jgi:hypothetical protein
MTECQCKKRSALHRWCGKRLLFGYPAAYDTALAEGGETGWMGSRNPGSLARSRRESEITDVHPEPTNRRRRQTMPVVVFMSWDNR